MLSSQLRFIHSLGMIVKSADMAVKEERNSVRVWRQDENTLALITPMLTPGLEPENVPGPRQREQ